MHTAISKQTTKESNSKKWLKVSTEELKWYIKNICLTQNKVMKEEQKWNETKGKQIAKWQTQT